MSAQKTAFRLPLKTEKWYKVTFRKIHSSFTVELEVRSCSTSADMKRPSKVCDVNWMPAKSECQVSAITREMKVYAK